MKPFFEAPSVTLYHGNALEVLRALPDQLVNCCVTSPPYWGLRDYGLPPTIWGGSHDCDHQWVDASWRPERWGVHDDDKPGEKQQTNDGSLGHRGAVKTQYECSVCGAWRGCFGLEPTPEMYVAHSVELFAEVRRVLKNDGSLWLNLGDSYCSTDKWGGGKSGNTGKQTVDDDGNVPSWAVRARKPEIQGLKPKDLCGIPWRVAFALQADGWYLRSDIIWSKPNPMPESVTDRPTKAHEYLFLLAKSERYYYDSDAIAEPATAAAEAKWDNGLNGHGGGVSHQGQGSSTRKFRTAGNKTHNVTEYEQSTTEEHRTKAGLLKIADTPYINRNKRSVWTVTTQPFPEAHFATFPEDLIRPCILAGCPPGGDVLDPFAGSGTTLLVARKLSCHGIGIELNSEYCSMIERRMSQQVFDLSAAP